MNTGQNQTRVVIIGGGFAGVQAAKRFEGEPGVSVTLITKDPFFEYYPALYKLVTGALAIEVCVPYTEIFSPRSSVGVIEGYYQSYDASRKEVLLLDGQRIAYDYLILAMGSESNYFGIPGIEEFAFSFKSAEEALALKKHFHDLLQDSRDVPKEELVKRFHVTVVGGGPSGVELAGDITTYLRRMTTRYHIDPSFVTVDLIESNSRVLSMMPESVSRQAEARLRKLKVNLYTNRTLQAQDIDMITASGMTLRSGTVIWTAGTKISSSFGQLPLDARKRVVVQNDFSLADDKAVFVIGDGASAAGTGLAQGAIHHGQYVAEAILCRIQAKTVPAYRGSTMGYLVPIGRNWAVFSYKTLTFSGVIPWLMRSMVDFRYFMSIVPLRYVFAVYRQGAKYRREDY